MRDYSGSYGESRLLEGKNENKGKVGGYCKSPDESLGLVWWQWMGGMKSEKIVFESIADRFY